MSPVSAVALRRWPHDIDRMRGKPTLFSILALAAAFAAQPAAAQSTPQACAAIADDGERLACYDAIFATTGTVDPDAVLLSSEQLIPQRPTGRAPATMSVACVSGQPQVTFGFAGQLVSATGDIAPVTFQIDQFGTSVRTLSADAANVALSFAPGRDSNAFLDSLAGGTNLRVRMTPVRQRSLTIDFRLPGIIDDIEALRANCR
jgi:hypothetical protein